MASTADIAVDSSSPPQVQFNAISLRLVARSYDAIDTENMKYLSTKTPEYILNTVDAVIWRTGSDWIFDVFGDESVTATAHHLDGVLQEPEDRLI